MIIIRLLNYFLVVVFLDDTLSRMLERLQEKFNGSEPHTPDEMHWQIDQAVVALFHLENKWHRAKILKVEGHRIQV